MYHLGPIIVWKTQTGFKVLVAIAKLQPDPLSAGKLWDQSSFEIKEVTPDLIKEMEKEMCKNTHLAYYINAIIKVMQQ